MKRYFLFLLLFMIIFQVGCGSSDSTDSDEATTHLTDSDERAAHSIDSEELEAYEVKQKFVESEQEDFIFRLVSEKEEYAQGEKVNLYAEIIYTGEEEKIEIGHAAKAVYFSLHEQVRGFEISSNVQEIGVQTELFSRKPYRESYKKDSIFYMGDESEEYIEFIEDFKEREDFPPGYYVVQATTDFHDGKENRKIKAEIDFKVGQ